jgi:PAS domain S-box-containing protein
MENFSTEEQLDLIKKSLDVIPRGILITDCSKEDDPIIYANEYFIHMSGYSREEIIGKNCRFMQGEKTDQESLKKIAIAIQNKEPCYVKMINYRKNGESFLNEFTICPVKDNSGNVTHFVALEREL